MLAFGSDFVKISANLGLCCTHSLTYWARNICVEACYIFSALLGNQRGLNDEPNVKVLDALIFTQPSPRRHLSATVSSTLGSCQN